eukprot:CAMPEP_0194364116 /NCGR_PEP_ID=MMETSP0174-20130528/12023_1 /TAXON_ID=216777 /ORGANISM="Proboscia alata, Strain PI-D3" /LENGTH=1007 /DNA_ID=CAMNT_0039137973 /DNA_START=49 /DNA_END=3069 /DNA_ORIENTATION=+
MTAVTGKIVVVRSTNNVISSKRKRALAEEKREFIRFATAVTNIANTKRLVVGVNYVEEENRLYPAYLSSYVLSGRADVTVNSVQPLNSNGKIKNLARLSNDRKNSIEQSAKENSNQHQNDMGNVVITPPPTSRRRPVRRKNTVTKKRAKYDMAQIPQFHRNSNFLKRVRRLNHSALSSKCEDKLLSLSSSNDGSVMEDSVVWVPKTRDQWFDSVDEMAGLCAEAALRSALTLHALHTARKRRDFSSESTQDVTPITTNQISENSNACYSAAIQPQEPRPLTKHYVNDRIDIDDPLQGFQLRHKNNGWLQGFLLWTTFTTWTRYFKWDSTHPKSGMNKKAYDAFMKSSLPASGGISRKWDHDGCLSSLLEAQPRSGDPFGTGVVWPTIAEIGILCGVGCGEYLFRMAIDEIISKGTYDYIVLQATESSFSFYERFGFCRVGAVTIYGKVGGCAGSESADKSRVVGYRHWTNADETNLREMHGAPSYMMAKSIKQKITCVDHNCEVCRFSFLDRVSEHFVSAKPIIETLSLTQKPARKACYTKERNSCYKRKNVAETNFLPLLEDLAKIVREGDSYVNQTDKSVIKYNKSKKNCNKCEDDSVSSIEETVSSDISTSDSIVESINRKSRYESGGRILFDTDEVRTKDTIRTSSLSKPNDKKRKRADFIKTNSSGKDLEECISSIDAIEMEQIDESNFHLKSEMTNNTSAVCGITVDDESFKEGKGSEINSPCCNELNTLPVGIVHETKANELLSKRRNDDNHKSIPEVVSSDEEVYVEDAPRIKRIKKEGQGLLSLNALLTLDRPKRLSMRPVLYEAVPASIAPLSDLNKTVTGSCGTCPQCNANCPIDSLKCPECLVPCKYVVGSGICLVAGLESKGKSSEKQPSRSSKQLRSEVRKSTSKKRRNSSYRNVKEFPSKKLPKFTAQVKLESMKSKLVMSDSVLKQRLAKKPRLYNKVVEFVTGVNGELNGYFFVLHCASDSCDAEIQIAKLESCGKFTQGSKERRGRVKW